VWVYVLILFGAVAGGKVGGEVLGREVLEVTQQEEPVNTSLNAHEVNGNMEECKYYIASVKEMNHSPVESAVHLPGGISEILPNDEVVKIRNLSY